MTELEGEVNDLPIRSIIGFDGAIVRGLQIHPDGQHLVYPLGNRVTIIHWETKKQDFLSGHTNVISSVDLSRTGKYIASGQINHIGFKAPVIIWDFATRTMLSKHEIHKVRIETLMFSKDEAYLMSLGGRDDGNVVVWDLSNMKLISGTEASRGSKGEATALATCNRRGPCFITGGDGNLIVWSIDVIAKSIKGVDVNLSKLKRVIYCIIMSERDEICYCGTSTGDVLKVRLNFHHDPELLIPIKPPMMQGCFTKLSKKKLPKGVVDLYKQGVRSLWLFRNGQLLIGAGDGTLDLVEETKLKNTGPAAPGCKIPSTPMLRVLKTAHLKSGITSIQMLTEKKFLAGTLNCEILLIDFDTFETDLLVTCHSSAIYYVAFPYNFSEVFATAGKDDVRVWDVTTLQELLRIKVKNFSCAAVEFSHDGKSILTAWNDGVIRAFTPLTGRLIYAIMNAHNKGVSALAITHHGGLLITGGCEGQVRLWNISPYKQELAITLKEHNAPISQIHVNKSDDEAVSASTDGSCIIWDLERQCRKQILFGNTLFMCVRYFPTGVQIVTGGTDRKLTYWEVLDGSLVREIEGSPSGAINSLDISEDGNLFATGGNDQIVKLWKYQEGITTHIGLGHSAVITGVRFSPDTKIIVSASAAGSIFVWNNPFYKEKEKGKGKKKSDTPVAKPAEKPVEIPIIENLTEKPVDSPKVKEEIIEDLPTARSTARSTASSKASSCHCSKRSSNTDVCQKPPTPC